MDVTNKILIICTTFNFPDELSQTLVSINGVLNQRNDAHCVILDNLSKDEDVHTQLDQINHDQITVIKNKVNHGKALSVNSYINQTLNETNCPRILISMDPDVTFDTNSFNQLVHALDTVPKLGMLGMRYSDNGCNPERSVWWPAKKIKVNNEQFSIRCPVFANVAGPLFGIQGNVLSECLKFKLFPKTKNEENIKKGYVKRAGSDDAYLYDYLKKFRLTQGYLEGTLINHLKAPPQTENYIQ